MSFLYACPLSGGVASLRRHRCSSQGHIPFGRLFNFQGALEELFLFNPFTSSELGRGLYSVFSEKIFSSKHKNRRKALWTGRFQRLKIFYIFLFPLQKVIKSAIITEKVNLRYDR